MTCNCTKCKNEQECKEFDKKGAKIIVEAKPENDGLNAKVKIEGNLANLVMAVGSVVLSIAQTSKIPAPLLLLKITDFCIDQEEVKLDDLKEKRAKDLASILKNLNEVIIKVAGGDN